MKSNLASTMASIRPYSSRSLPHRVHLLLQDTDHRVPEICQTLYDHPEGLDPPFDTLYDHVKQGECKDFTKVEAKAGDIFITHGLLPHAHTPNHLHYARVITNPHVNMHEPFNLNRADGDYVCSLPPRSD